MQKDQKEDLVDSDAQKLNASHSILQKKANLYDKQCMSVCMYECRTEFR